MKNIQSRQSGGVSLFVVIFAAILFSVIALSFVAIMNQEQKRSANQEISQSAYDSAMSGVEDAKRLIINCYNNKDSQACQALEDEQCTSVAQGGIAGNPTDRDEIKIKGNSSDTKRDGSDLNQAYTCVKVLQAVPDFLGSTSGHDGAITIPLSGDRDVAYVNIEWQKERSTSTEAIGFNGSCDSASASQLCTKAQWGDMPAMLRARFIIPTSSSPENSFRLSDLNSAQADTSYFLRPTSAPNVPTVAPGTSAIEATTKSAGNVAAPASCVLANEYKCTIKIRMPRTIPAKSKFSVLRLKTLYRGADLRVTMYDSSDNLVNFYGVQTVIDSTGRAGDIFRRIEARLMPRTKTDATIPDHAIDIDGSLCKSFAVIDDVSDGFPSEQAACTP